MVALPKTRLTLGDIQKRMDPKGAPAKIVELLNQRGMKGLHGIQEWMPGNLPNGHETTQRTVLPTAYLRDYNEGVLPSVSETAQITDNMSQIESWCEIDPKVANRNGGEAAYLASESTAFIESMWQMYTQLYVYGNAKQNSKEFNGLATRHSSINSGNIINCTGVAGNNNTSVYLVEYGDDVWGSYPEGETAGLEVNDMGYHPVQFSDGKRMRARVCQYTMQAGLVVRDWRRIGRAMNIAVAHLRAGDNTQATSASTNIIFALFDLLAMLPDTSGRRAFLCNRTVISCIGKMGLRFGSNVVTVESGLTQFGDMTKEWTQVKFLGVPLIPIDRILNTEAQITT